MRRPLPGSTLFPYTTLFRSDQLVLVAAALRDELPARVNEVRLAVELADVPRRLGADAVEDRKSTRLNSSHVEISYAVFCLKKKKTTNVSIPATPTARIRTSM